jgi:hypothetical protein
MEKKTQKRGRAKSSPNNRTRPNTQLKKQCTLEGYITQTQAGTPESNSCLLPDKEHEHDMTILDTEVDRQVDLQESDIESTQTERDVEEALKEDTDSVVDSVVDEYTDEDEEIEDDEDTEYETGDEAKETMDYQLTSQTTDVSEQCHTQTRTRSGKKDPTVRIFEQLEAQSNVLSKILEIQEEMRKSMTEENSKIKKLEERVSKLELCQVNSPDENEHTKEVIARMEDQVNRIERKQRENNLRLIGIREINGEDCKSIVDQILYNDLNFEARLEVAHRTGRRIDGRPRHIIFRVDSVYSKTEILKRQRVALQGVGYFITDDLTISDLLKKRAFSDQIGWAKRQGQRWQFKNGRLFIEGEEMFLEELDYRETHTTLSETIRHDDVAAESLYQPPSEHSQQHRQPPTQPSQQPRQPPNQPPQQPRQPLVQHRQRPSQPQRQPRHQLSQPRHQLSQPRHQLSQPRQPFAQPASQPYDWQRQGRRNRAEHQQRSNNSRPVQHHETSRSKIHTSTPIPRFQHNAANYRSTPLQPQTGPEQHEENTETNRPIQLTVEADVHATNNQPNDNDSNVTNE